MPKVDYGKKDESAPAGKGCLFPFMINPVWLAAYNAKNDPLRVEATDPAGFSADEGAEGQPSSSI